MTTQTEALKMALEALEICYKDCYIPVRLTREAITAIKEALAQPEHEPVGEAYLCDRCQTPFDGAYECPRCGGPMYTRPEWSYSQCDDA